MGNENNGRLPTTENDMFKFTADDWKNVCVTAVGVAAAALVTMAVNYAINTIRGLVGK